MSNRAERQTPKRIRHIVLDGTSRPQQPENAEASAEEVEKVNPELVARDEEGKIMSVRYEAVKRDVVERVPQSVGRLCQAPMSKLAFHRMEPLGRERHRRAGRLGERARANESKALQQKTKDLLKKHPGSLCAQIW